MIRGLLIALLAMATPVFAQAKGPCAPGKAATDYKDWEYIANNAFRTADDYAVKKNPDATFILAEIEAIYQVAGKHAGHYLVKLVNSTPNGISFAMLKPNFNFCADPSSLDDAREDLFNVVLAKFNGRPF